MAATDQLYRSQKTLDVVFGISCAAMLVTTLWMFADDYYRPFKKVQRTFRDVEATLAERELVDKLPAPEDVREKNRAVRAARRAVEKAKNAVARIDRELKARREKADDHYRAIKAEYDAQMSYYNIAIDDAGKYPEDSTTAQSYRRKAERILRDLQKLEADLAAAKARLDEIDEQIKDQVTAVTAGPEQELAQAEDELKKLTGVSDRFAKQAALRAWSTGDTIRALPILDGFESPIKIKQIWLPDLTIDYSFKEVPRFDRCTTCHLGIDRGNFDKEALARLGDEEESRRLTGKLQGAKELLEQRYDPVDSWTSRLSYNLFGPSYHNLGFSPHDLPGERRGHLGLVALLMLLCVLVAAGSLGILERSARVGVRVLTAGVVLTLLTTGALAVFSPRETTVKAIKLSDAQITQYAAHPRLDLFVDANSPHSQEKFGCTICHAGQGSATDFNLASHTPSGAVQEDHWKEKHHYHANHYWDFPMLPNRFIESSCLKCHHQVTDLIRHGSKEEAPKLLKGYHLVQEMGCFGCHEIQGIKGGRPVGPDLRLEPTPALELLSAAEQEKAKSDPLNPPGTYRKVGPSLRRLAEKVSLDWTVAWINDPRGFRPDTKMPHFFNLSTNSKKALEATHPEQANFPAAEIHAIAHYLMQESKGHLQGQDFYRNALLSGKDNLNALQKKLVEAGLSDKEMKDLFDVSRRFADLALLSAPERKQSLNALATTQRQLQERLAELQKRAAETDAVKPEIKSAGDELRRVTESLVREARPAPISAGPNGLVGSDGERVTLPAKPGDPARGRELFTEKGCLACHAHEGTAKPYQKEGKTLVHAVSSDANFAPELSRLADKVTSREWLVQWLLNPNVYHPRTRMPITHLSVEQANDLATWLLEQKTGWKGAPTDPAEPSLADYKRLARVYLAKAPGVTRKEVDEFLPESGDELPGIPRERLEAFPRDAEERALEQGMVNQQGKLNALKWYIGKKAIGKQGCFGCHDIPGFETAKPIGTGLNDWGKKDPARLAFEDAESFVKEHFNIVPTRVTRAEVEKLIADLEAKPDAERTPAERRKLGDLQKQVQAQPRIKELEDKALQTGLSRRETEELQKLRPLKFFEPVAGEHGVKEPFEEAFFRALELGHQHREGFLQLKLFDPRSFDYNRVRVWDDRLRMPQFKFARTRQRPGEAREAFAARQAKEEAEAREAVMTFILGLVADNIPLKYVANPAPEKKAEAVGRAVLDKYNCAGCHQIRPGVYEFKASDVVGRPGSPGLLDRAYADAARNYASDHVFQGHSAWFGTLPATPDRLTAFGYIDPVATERNQEAEGLTGTDTIRLTEALRFVGADGLMHDLRAGSTFYLPRGQYRESLPFGGTFTDLLVPYLTRKDSAKFPRDDAGKARTVLPPPLVREGERVQPDWLYKFLLNPLPIRPMFPESTAGVLLRMPKFNMSPEEAQAIVNYFAAVAKVSNPGAGVTAPYVFIEQREPEFWRRTTESYQQSLKDMRATARDNAAKDKGWETRIKLIEAAQTSTPPKGAKVTDLYSRQAYKLLTHRDLCLKCHPVGPITIEGAQGPNLALAAERLRPEWVEQWVAHPTRMFPYNPVMPQNFPGNPDPLQWTYQDAFVGTPLQQVRAVRDLIMDQPRLAELIATMPPPPPPAPETKDTKK